MKRIVLPLALLVLAACSKSPEAPAEKVGANTPSPPASGMMESPVPTEAPAGPYTLDKAHSTLLFRVNHIGFSRYTASFKNFDATLELDPKNPETASVTATIDPRSLQIAAPPLGFLDKLLGPQWLNASEHPEITFKSTAVGMTGENTARVAGDLTMRGVTQPVVLDVTFNGGYAGHPYDPNARIGFSARGSFSRSAFGVDYGVPEPGTTMGVGDTVEVVIEAEFTGPAQTQPAE